MKLGDVFKLSSGKSLPEKNRISGSYNVYGGNGITGNHNDYFVDETTVVIGRVGEYCGTVHLTTEKSWVTDNALMVTKWYKKVNKQYLVYMLNAMNLHQYAKTVGQPSISQANIYGLEVDLPSIEQQKKIVTVLNLVSKVINDRKKEIEELDNLIKSRFVEMFGERGKVVPLTDYVWFQEGPGVRSIDFTSEGTILLTGSNINDNQISFGYKSDRFISDELANGKYAHFMCDKDDILVVSSAIAPEKFDKKVTTVEEDKKYCLNTGIIRFKPNQKVMTLGYFREFLKTDYFKYQVMAEMRGIAQMHFGPSHLKQMTILLPESMEQQIEFETFVNQVDKLKFEVQKALDETQLLMDSLMQEYFG